MWDAGAVTQNAFAERHAGEACPYAGRDRSERVVRRISGEMDFLHRSPGGALRAIIVADEADRTVEADDVKNHAMMPLPCFHSAVFHGGKIDFTKAGKNRVGGAEHVKHSAALVGDLAEWRDDDAFDHAFTNAFS